MSIGVIDSGSGGISTLSALLSVLPNEDYIYIADKSYAPYGNKSDEMIFERVITLCSELKRQKAKAVVIACNTATNVAIDLIRGSPEGQDMVYVGVEPPIKPAYEELKWGKALVLLTNAAARQQKFINLISGYDPKKIIISPQADLARLIEENINDLSKTKHEILKIYNNHKGDNIESVALGCTHYCLIKNYIYEAFNAKIYDSNTGTAIRLYTILKQRGQICRKGGGSVKFICY